MYRKIRILHLTDRILPGGAMNGILKRIKYLNNNRYTVEMCCLTDKNSYMGAFKKQNINVKCLNMKSNKDLIRLYNLIFYLINKKPDILHTHFSNSDMYGVLLGKLLKIPIIITTIHMRDKWVLQNTLRHKIRHNMEKRTYRLFDKIASISDGVKQFEMKVHNIPEEKFSTILNGIELDKFKKRNKLNLRTAFQDNKETKLVGTAGRFSEEKGQKYLIKAMPSILNKFPNTKLLLIGEGCLRETFEKMVNELNIKDKIIFTGYRNDIPDILSILDVFVLPSLSEGLPNILLEAMACSLPCVSTKVGGTAEVIDDTIDGFLIEVGDEKLITEKVVYLLNHPKEAEKIGKAARKKIENKFNIEQTVKNLEKIYDTLVEEKLKKGEMV